MKTITKKSLSILLSILMLLTVLPAGAMSAMAGTYNGYTYTVENGETTITKYDGTGGAITIPDMLGGAR